MQADGGSKKYFLVHKEKLWASEKLDSAGVLIFHRVRQLSVGTVLLYLLLLNLEVQKRSLFSLAEI